MLYEVITNRGLVQRELKLVDRRNRLAILERAPPGNLPGHHHEQRCPGIVGAEVFDQRVGHIVAAGGGDQALGGVRQGNLKIFP